MSNFKRIDPQQAEQLLEQGAGLVDIRDPGSFDAAHIPGAVRLDNANLQQFLARTNQERPLIVCCYHGNSSQPAAAYLADEGFAEVYSLDGGFELWYRTFPDKVEAS
ncbi:thiosulfate sulfurtransferase GlpE [Pseudomonas sp.]|jgi:thiosulfate sulfurtransferase|uniref:thiosulfate sulfurtransferase GlpE n=1 Tax=Pseudomonas sp. TaxID=306 RepID=UPI00272C9468|nr:thiosulfate sulfurtransferase GlpE [Pseudomonas sp.]